MRADGKNESQDLDRNSGKHERRPGPSRVQQKDRRCDDQPASHQEKKSRDSHVF